MPGAAIQPDAADVFGIDPWRHRQTESRAVRIPQIVRRSMEGGAVGLVSRFQFAPPSPGTLLIAVRGRLRRYCFLWRVVDSGLFHRR